MFILFTVNGAQFSLGAFLGHKEKQLMSLQIVTKSVLFKFYVNPCFALIMLHFF